MNTAAKTYLIRFSTAMTVYIVLLIASVMVAQNVPDGNPLKYALMLLPVIPVVFALMAFVRYFESMDELQKRIQLYALAFSFATSGMLFFTYGMLETAGLPHLSWVWAFPVMIMLWGLGGWIATRRYA